MLNITVSASRNSFVIRKNHWWISAVGAGQNDLHLAIAVDSDGCIYVSKGPAPMRELYEIASCEARLRAKT